MSLKTLLIDDEQYSLDLLKTYCKQISEIDVIAAFSCPLQALSFIQNNEVDLIISDVDMPGLSGVELAQSLSKPIPTILITAHAQYAVEGFALDVVDYLLKPVMLPRFIKAVNKVVLRNKDLSMVAKAVEPKYLFVKDGQLRRRISCAKISYIQSQGDYLEIHLSASLNDTGDNASKTSLLLLYTLTEFLEMLPAKDFVRIHRSTVINLARVDYVEKDHLVIEGQDLNIGKTYRSSLLSIL